MVRIMAHRAVHGIGAKMKLATNTSLACFGFKHSRASVPGRIQATALASLHGTGQLLASPDFHQDEFPSLIEDLLDIAGDVNHFLCRNDIVVAVDVSVKHLVEPKAIPGLAVLLQVFNFGEMRYLTFPTE